MPFPKTGSRFRPAALLRIEFRTCFLFLCHTQRPMADRKIQRSDGHCFGWQQLLANSIEILILHEIKSDSSLPEIYKALKPCLLLNWVSITREVACFPPGKRAAWAGSCLQQLQQTGKRPVLVLAYQTRWLAGAQTWTQTWTLQPGWRVVKVFWNQSINCVEFEFFLSQLLMPNLNQAIEAK